MVNEEPSGRIAIACETCPSYVRQSDKSGVCRHNPPQVFLVPGPADPLTGNPTVNTRAIWPAMGATDWCGQHPMFGIRIPADQRLAATKGQA